MKLLPGTLRFMFALRIRANSDAAPLRARTSTLSRRYLWVRRGLVLLLMLAGLDRCATAAIIFVTTTQQKVNATGGCSLQEAIYSANFDDNIAIDPSTPLIYDAGGDDNCLVDGSGSLLHTQCVPGSGDDVIVLPAGAVLQMTDILYDPHNYTGLTATPLIFTNVTIEGYGAQLHWTPTQPPYSAPDAPLRYARAFAVGTASVALPEGGTASGAGHSTISNV